MRRPIKPLVGTLLLLPCLWANAGLAADPPKEAPKAAPDKTENKGDPAKPATAKPEGKGDPTKPTTKPDGKGDPTKTEGKSDPAKPAAKPDGKGDPTKTEGKGDPAKPAAKPDGKGDPAKTEGKSDPAKTAEKPGAKGDAGKPAAAAKPTAVVEKSILDTLKQSVASSVTDKPVYYPQCSATPLRLGEENYQKGYASLHGLTGVYVNIEDVIKSASSRNLKLEKNLVDLVVKRLNDAGMRLLTKEEMELTPGQPEMSMFASFPKHLGPFKEGEPRPEYNPACCTAGIWTSFTQGATTLRDPLTRYKFGTWGEGHNTTDCSNIGAWLSEVVLKTVDDFVADKKKGEDELAKGPAVEAPKVETVAAKPEAAAKPAATEAAPAAKPDGAQASVGKPAAAAPAPEKPAPAPVVNTPAATGNMECNTALMMYIEMFKTGQSEIMPSKYFVLDKLAQSMLDCPDYNYMIETHADQRSDFSFNEKLTKDRAQSVQQYLNFKDIPTNRFEIQWFGETRPVTMGTTEEDYAANRRVVITPYKVKK